MKKTVRFALLSATLGLLSTSAAFAKVDRVKLALSVKHAVAADPSATLQIVEKQVSLTPACACELVKAAIQGSKADVKLVAAIVETAATVAPEHRHLIGQCAVAVAPDALAAVQAVLAKLEPKPKQQHLVSAHNTVPEAAKPSSNPLDFPGSSIEAYLAATTGNGNNSDNNSSGGSGNSSSNSGGDGNNGGDGGNGGNGGHGGHGGNGGNGGGFIGGLPGGPGGGGFTPPPAGTPGGGGGGVVSPPDVTDVTNTPA